MIKLRVGADSDGDLAALLLVGADGCGTIPISLGNCAALRYSYVGIGDSSIDYPALLPTSSPPRRHSGGSYSHPRLVSLGNSWSSCRRLQACGLCQSVLDPPNYPPSAIAGVLPGASNLPALLAQARANLAQARADRAAWELKMATIFQMALIDSFAINKDIVFVGILS